MLMLQSKGRRVTAETLLSQAGLSRFGAEFPVGVRLQKLMPRNHPYRELI